MKSNSNMREFVNRDEVGSDSDDDEDAPIELELVGFDIEMVQDPDEMQNIVVIGADGEENVVIHPDDDDDDDDSDDDDYEDEEEAAAGGPPNAAAVADSSSAAESSAEDQPAPNEGADQEAGPAPSAGRVAVKRKAPLNDSDDSSSDGSFDQDAPDSDDFEDSDVENAASGMDEEDDVVKAIIANTRTARSHPPDIETEEFVVDLSFHPEEDILTVGTLGGDVLVYKYTNEENTLVTTLEMHTKAIRAIEFNHDGSTLFSASKDKTIVLSDVHTGKLKRFYDEAHTAPVYSMYVLDENLFASGDEDGVLKLWDIRERTSTPIFELKEVDDYISSILTNSANKMLLITSGDGYLTAINIGARKMYVQSEPYDEELTCMGLFRNESKLVVGSSKGRFYNYNWDEFGVHSNMYPGPKSPLSLMIPVTDRIAITGGEEGILRAMHTVPGRNLGVVGQHSLGVEAMDISNSGELVASSSHDNDIKFWNIKYFEDFDDIRYNEKQHKTKEQRHNLPSSKQGNAGDFFADLV